MNVNWLLSNQILGQTRASGWLAEQRIQRVQSLGPCALPDGFEVAGVCQAPVMQIELRVLPVLPEFDRQQRFHLSVRRHWTFVHPGHDKMPVEDEFPVFASDDVRALRFRYFEAEAAPGARAGLGDWREPLAEQGRIDPAFENAFRGCGEAAGHTDRFGFGGHWYRCSSIILVPTGGAPVPDPRSGRPGVRARSTYAADLPESPSPDLQSKRGAR